jgi:alpha-beta hydrolase superfamily lysophospholipase
MPPLFVAGQSLGGLLAASAAVREPQHFAGLLLFSPALDVEMNLVLRLQSVFAAPLAAVMPWARIVAAVRTKDMSDDPVVCIFMPVTMPMVLRKAVNLQYAHR